MPSIQDSIKKHEDLIAAGKANPVPDPVAVAPIPSPMPMPVGTGGILGPIRGSYQPAQILATDFKSANSVAGNMRSPVFPMPPATANVTASSAAKAAAAAATASETTSTILPNDIVQASGPNGTLQSGPITASPTPLPTQKPIGGVPRPGVPTPTPSRKVGPPGQRVPLNPVVIDQVTDGPLFGKTLQTALTANQIDPTKSGVLMKGSLPPMYSGAFTYTSTTTSITVSWNNLVIYRADGTTTNVGSGSQAVTGLVAGETYNFLAYWNESTASLVWISSSNLANPLQTIVGVNFQNSGSNSGYVSTANSITLSASYSVELWFNSTSSGEEGLIGFGPQTGILVDGLLEMGSVTAGEITFIGGTTGSITSPATYNDGNWHHVVATYNGATLILYIDGVQVATGGGSGTRAANFLRFAQDLNATENNTLAYCAFYNGLILSATQVTNHFDTMVVSGTASYAALVIADGVTNFWELQETSGTSAADSVGTNTGTYQNLFTLNQSQQIENSQGSPSIAWIGVPIQVVQTSVLQGHISIGILAASTPATGTGGGTGGGSGGSGGGDKRVSG